jgi:hypothetical protein
MVRDRSVSRAHLEGLELRDRQAFHIGSLIRISRMIRAFIMREMAGVQSCGR